MFINSLLLTRFPLLVVLNSVKLMYRAYNPKTVLINISIFWLKHIKLFKTDRDADVKGRVYSKAKLTVPCDTVVRFRNFGFLALLLPAMQSPGLVFCPIAVCPVKTCSRHHGSHQRVFDHIRRNQYVSFIPKNFLIRQSLNHVNFVASPMSLAVPGNQVVQESALELETTILTPAASIVSTTLSHGTNKHSGWSYELVRADLRMNFVGSFASLNNLDLPDPCSANSKSSSTGLGFYRLFSIYCGWS